MKKHLAFAIMIFGILALTAEISVAGCGARWYPFYGYRQPSYLATPAVVVVQPPAATVQQSGPQAYTTNYGPSQPSSVAPASAAPASAAPASAAPATNWSRSSSGGQWYPFYGYRRPAYLDR